MEAKQVLHRARERAGLSQRELAARAGTSQSAIARYERGAVTPSVHTLARLVRACGLELELGLSDGSSSTRHQVADLLALSPAQRLESLRRFAATRESVKAVGR